MPGYFFFDAMIKFGRGYNDVNASINAAFPTDRADVTISPGFSLSAETSPDEVYRQQMAESVFSSADLRQQPGLMFELLLQAFPKVRVG